MGESLLLITIITLVVLTIRRARPVILETPVIIQRPGQYQITLAPQLNRAQIFVEQIAKQFAQLHQSGGDLSTQYFEVRDPKVFSKGENSYLLAIAYVVGCCIFRRSIPSLYRAKRVATIKPCANFLMQRCSIIPFQSLSVRGSRTSSAALSKRLRGS